MTVTARRFAPDEWRTYRQLRLASLADAPYSFGSTYERESSRTDAEWEERLARTAASHTEMPVVAFMDETPVGLAWGRRNDNDPTVGHLFQVWVSPDYRGRGVARLLTNVVIAWARRVGLRTLRLGVAPSHPAAVRLYRSVGFVDAGEPEPLRPGSPVFCQPMQLVLELPQHFTPPTSERP